MTRAHEDALTVARKPTPLMSLGDDVALPGVGIPEPQVRPPVPPEARPEATEKGRGRRPILDKSAPTLVDVHPSGKPASAIRRRSGPQSEGARLFTAGNLYWMRHRAIPKLRRP